MPDLLSLSILLPLLGGGCILLASFLLSKLAHERWRIWILSVALILSIAVLALVFLLRHDEGMTVLPSPWQSSLLADFTIRFHLDVFLWPLSLVMAFATCCLLSAELGRQNPPLLTAAISPMLLAFSLAALWSANPLTTLVSWALYDLTLLLGQVVVGARGHDVVRNLAVGSLASMLLWAGMLVGETGTGNVQWALMPPDGAKMTFWTIAGLLRLGVYPLLPFFPGRVGSSSSLAAMLALSPLIGWGLWVRLAVIGDGVLPVSSWMMVPALLTFAVGTFLGWTAKSLQGIRSWVGAGSNGAILIVVVLASLHRESLGGERGMLLPIMALGVGSWMLNVAVLSLGGGFSIEQLLRWDRLPLIVPSLLGALSLIGTPVTLGFVTESSLMKCLVNLKRWDWILGFFVGHVFLVGAVSRWLFSATFLEEERINVLNQIAHHAGLIGAAVSIVIIGAVPPLLLGVSAPPMGVLLEAPSLIGWLLWGGTLLLGGILAWQDRHIRVKNSSWLRLLHDIVRFDWAYRLLVGAFERAFALLRAVDEVLGGRAAVLWSFILLLILILVWGIG